MPKDHVDSVVKDIETRLDEIQPVVEEYERLMGALRLLRGDGALRGPSGARRPTGRKPGRPPGSGFRGSEALKALRQQPGMTVAEIAAEIGTHRNYLFRVLPALADQGLLIKRGPRWYPVGSEPSSKPSTTKNSGKKAAGKAKPKAKRKR
ncbi:MAG: helix-turn-helix domain-containing protein [Actinomycetes bacterium]